MEEVRRIEELVNRFANLADVKDAVSQGQLFLEDGILEFQKGISGEIKNIVGRENLVKAFKATIEPCLALYHLNGQHSIKVDGDIATGVAYCQATLVNDVDGKQILTVNNVRYTDEYQKLENRWYIKKRRTTFLISDIRELNI